MMDIKVIKRGQMYRYYLRQVVVGDYLRPVRTPLGIAQVQVGVPPGRWTGRGLGDLGLRPGAIVTEDELRQLFGQGRHPHGDRLVAEALTAGKTPAVAARAGRLGRAVEVTGADLVFRPQPTIQLMWALGEEETRQVIEAAHERAIEATLAWIEDHAATIRVGAQGRYPTRPVHGLAFARFRHYESRAGTPLLHDHVLVSLRGLRLDGKWGAVHSTTLLENVVAASSLYNELVMVEVCEALDVASEPRTVSAGRRPVMEIGGVPHELIGWMSQRGQEIDLCRQELEHEYVTAVDGDGNLKFGPVVSEQARTKLNRIAARKTRPPKPKARSLTQLRTDWRASAKEFLGEAAELVDSLLERARAAAAAIRARVAETLDVALAALGISAMVFVMSSNGLFHRRHLLAEARRFLALVQRGRRREPGLDDEIVNAAIAAHCLDITEPKTTRGLLADYRLYTTHWAHPDPARSRRRAPEAVPDTDHWPPADLTAPNVPAPPGKPGEWDIPRDALVLPVELGEWDIPRVPLRYDRAVIASTALTRQLRAARGAGRTRYYEGVTAHQQAAMPEQLLLFPIVDANTDAEEPEGEPADYMERLRALRKARSGTDVQDLTTEQISSIQTRIEEMKRRGQALRERYEPRPEAPAPRPILEHQERGQGSEQPGTGHGGPSR
ncbi:MobF family relaxase [Streptomyces sp. NPDC056529]|uniref:MobF family relaxase n=1 Tax=Streptomyces sp. NPDC056529 TaxID=3345855 RepID=UPI0036C24C40